MLQLEDAPAQKRPQLAQTAAALTARGLALFAGLLEHDLNAVATASKLPRELRAVESDFLSHARSLCQVARREAGSVAEDALAEAKRHAEQAERALSALRVGG
jgi:hypothetical protein